MHEASTDHDPASGRALGGGAPPALTEDRFLGGRLTLRQPASGFRAGLESVMLAAGVPARPGARVLELGLGAGVAALCLAARVPGLDLTGLELDPELAALAAANHDRARAEGALEGRLTALVGDVAAPPAALGREAFDEVYFNPPFFPAGSATSARDAGRARARMLPGLAGLGPWVAAALACLRPGGGLAVIIRPESLPELLGLLKSPAGSIEVLALWPGTGSTPDRPAKAVLVRARKGGRAPFRLLPGLVLHEGDGRFTAAAEAVLRGGAALPGA